MGRWLVPLLKEKGHEMLILSRTPEIEKDGGNGSVAYVCGDLQDCGGFSSSVEDFHPEALIHLAWEGIPDYSQNMSLRNLENGLNVFSLAQEIGCSFILSTGSCWEYAARNDQQREDAPIGAENPFQATKNALRLMGEAMARESGHRFYWLRLFYVYGPGQKPNSLIPYVVDSINRNEVPQIQNPSNRNDFVYVKDVAGAIVSVLETLPENCVYNVGSGSSISVSEMVRTACRAMDKPYCFPSIEYPGNGIPEDFWADISRIEKDTGWTPSYDLSSGMNETVEGYGGMRS